MVQHSTKAAILILVLLPLIACASAATLPGITLPIPTMTESAATTTTGSSNSSTSLVTLTTPGQADPSRDIVMSGGLEIRSDFPARIVEAGETVIFLLNIKEGGTDQDPRRLWASFGGGVSGWEYAFRDDSSEVGMVDLPPGTQKSVRLEVDTAAETEPGRYPVAVHVGDESYTVYVTISRSHAGDRGTLKLVVYPCGCWRR